MPCVVDAHLPSLPLTLANVSLFSLQGFGATEIIRHFLQVATRTVPLPFKYDENVHEDRRRYHSDENGRDRDRGYKRRAVPRRSGGDAYDERERERERL